MKLKRWTEEETQKLIDMYLDGATYEEMVEELGRTVSAVRSRLRDLRYSGKLMKMRQPERKIEANLKKELNQLYAENKLLKQRLKLLEEDEAVVQKVLDLVSAKLDSLPPLQPKEFKYDKKEKLITTVPICIWADWHIGEKVREEDTRGLGKYDFGVFKKRLWFMVERTCKILLDIMKGYHFPELQIVMLGDMVSGMRHQELRETNDLDIIEQLFDGSEEAASAIYALAKEFRKVNVLCIYGLKHSTFDLRLKYKERYVNLDYIFYRILELRLKNVKNVTFRIPKSFFDILDVNGWKFLCYHGDDIRSWAGIPYYGIERDINKFRKLLQYAEEKFHYVMLAHFHTPTQIEGEVIISGSMKGADEFTLGAVRRMTPAQQRIVGIHKEWGITFSFPIYLDHIR